MEGFYLLCGHLLGDYILQNDVQAANKTNPWPGKRPGYDRECEGGGSIYVPGDPETEQKWIEASRKWWVGHLACTVHCLLYTLAVWACSFWWMPWWGVVTCFLTHLVIDRFRLARLWMDHMSGQKAFAEKMGPWSVIVVDNTAHLLTLAGIAAVAGRI